MANDNNENEKDAQSTDISSGKKSGVKKPDRKKTDRKKETVEAVSKETGEQNSTDPVKKKQRRGKKERWCDRLSPEQYARYEERTQRLAAGAEKSDEDEHLETYIRFRLGVSEKYGIVFSHVDEILYSSGIASVPLTPDFIAGVINRSGDMLTIIDLRSFFRAEKKDYSAEARIIVVEGGGIKAGLLVDEVEGNANYDPAKLAPPLPSEGVSDMRYIKGIHQGNITMLDIEALLSDQAIRVG